MSRSTLFVFSLGLALGLGFVQGIARPALLVVGGVIVIAHLFQRRWAIVLACLLGCALGGGRAVLAWNDVTRPLPTELALQATVVAIKNNSAWLGEVSCTTRPCPTGVVLPQQKSLGSRWNLRCQFASLSGSSLWSWWGHGMVATCITKSAPRALAPTIFGRLLGVRSRITDGFGRLLAPHEAGLLNGIVLGDTSAMPSDTNNDFRRTGTSHIVALSGFNVTIILNSLVLVLLPFIGKRWTSICGLGLVVLFVVMTGASSSVVRAAVMAAAVQSGKLLGRPLHPDRMLLYAVCAMSLWNPWLLWHDLGFQLSVTSTFGLLRVRPALERFGQWLPELWEIRDNALSTVAATLASGPLLMSAFGQWSIVSILSNTLVLPLIPIIMGLGALMTLCLWLPAGALHIVLAPTEILLRLVLRVLHVLAGWSWAAVPLSLGSQTIGMLFCVALCLYAYDVSSRSVPR